ncbi:hypothetical protein Cgig2_029003 [Carnegiea gigantea]|uniref:Uncharacterized protein n=1 Tax=Carnegiea gigantea TaxID=171969 RepID=A0A9Q1GIY6_9CARY|nr:hypothetical protein Cgig2_029003 [Carnegiea gigantea]
MPAVSLPVRKKQGTKKQHGETGASAPSQDLAALGTSDLPKVSEQEIAMAEVFARGVKTVTQCRRLEGLISCYQRRCERLQEDLEARETEKKALQRQLEKAAADSIQAKEQGYQQGRFDTLKYLRKVVPTLAGEFEDDWYFEAYLRFVDEQEWAAAEGPRCGVYSSFVRG